MLHGILYHALVLSKFESLHLSLSYSMSYSILNMTPRNRTLSDQQYDIRAKCNKIRTRQSYLYQDHIYLSKYNAQ